MIDGKNTVLIIDDHSIVRMGLRTLLEGAGFLRVVAEASGAVEGEALAAKLKPDVVILDVRLPDGDGISLCGRIKEVAPDSRVILLTAYPSPYLVETALQEGADGILLKTIDGEEILNAVEIILKGKVKISADLFSSFLESARSRLRTPGNSESEVQLLGLLARGFTNKEIAESLGIAEKTVRNRLSMLYRKLGVGNRTEAALLESGTIVPTKRDY